MYYHVIVDFPVSNRSHWWLDLDYDSLSLEILIPFINKQVVPVTYGTGKAIFNFATVTYLRVFKTTEALGEENIEETKRQLFSQEFEKYECTQEIIERFLAAKSPMESKSLLQTLFMPTKPQVFEVGWKKWTPKSCKI